MASPAFTKFDPRAFLECETWKATALMHAKAAEAPVHSAEHRPTLAGLATLAGQQVKIENSNQPPKRFPDAQDEQAAVVEFDAYEPHARAEAVAKLDTSEPPIDVPTKRWMRFIDDCRLFLGGDAARAFALGWGALDLFGCDRERPFARIDHMGLLWLINGGALFELHRDRALIITTGQGARQCFRRRPVEVGRTVPGWSLSGTLRPVWDEPERHSTRKLWKETVMTDEEHQEMPKAGSLMQSAEDGAHGC
jgi:hypothetical protein